MDRILKRPVDESGESLPLCSYNLTKQASTVWERSVNAQGVEQYKCLACEDHVCSRNNRATHESRYTHKNRLSRWERNRTRQPLVTPEDIDVPNQEILLSATQHLVHSLAHPPGQHSACRHHRALTPDPLGGTWGMLYDEDTGELPNLTTEEQAELDRIRQEAQDLEEIIFLPSDDEDAAAPERSSGEEEDDDVNPSWGGIDVNALGALPRKRRRLASLLDVDGDYYPWPDRLTFTLDVFMHLARVAISDRHLDLHLWLLGANGVHGIPGVKAQKAYVRDLQKLYGIRSTCYEGSLGHRYYVNNIGDMLSQEMANPNVRENLKFYPKDSGPELSEAREASRWLRELPPELTTPWIRLGGKDGQDYFTFEPALTRNNEIVIPVRWFEKDGRFYAQCWNVRVVYNDQRELVWQAIMPSDPLKPRVVCTDDLLKPMADLATNIQAHPQDYIKVYHALPPILRISEVYDPNASPEQPNKPWPEKYGNENGNPWRVRAQARNNAPVLALPIWLYCDDTSGNTSKKWNCHHSYLFTLAGLPRSEAAKEYNVQFLCTSNIARPLEMAEGVVNDIKKAQDEGVWAWDVKWNRPVLVFPVILALLGDNPMQSEFSSHIGLRGRLFCRSCKVSGASRAKKDDDEGIGDPDSEGEEDEEDEEDEEELPGGERAPSPAGSTLSTLTQGNNQWSSSGIFRRLKSFIKAGVPRRSAETVQILESHWESASTKPGAKEAIKRDRTAHGVKDTFQAHFLDEVFDSYKNKRKAETREAALKDAVSSLLRRKQKHENMINPLLRVEGLDPHHDTPVEILHVVLLGFVKYFWRDVIRNQLGKKKAEKKLKLADRLSSIDVSGLGLSPLQGDTLVNYSGSLVGRDFRAIAQVAPFVLKGMVTDKCYNTWLALSKLIPLVWQPRIDDVQEYIATLDAEIEHFLVQTASWSGAWFNKPKFHILVHLPSHILRFGPAILFATEAFESFNAVIRAKSIHSNRQAPSRDIALAFARANRIRHILSNGLFLRATSDCLNEAQEDGVQHPPAFSNDPMHWKSMGPKAKLMLENETPVHKYLGLSVKRSPCGWTRHPEYSEPVPYSELKAAIAYPQKTLAGTSFWPGLMCVLPGGDKCKLEDFVAVSEPRFPQIQFVAQVSEIIKSSSNVSDMPDALLVRACQLAPGPQDSDKVNPYGMPYIRPTNLLLLLPPENVFCTLNTQHDCWNHKCELNGTRIVRQERAASTKTRRVLKCNNPSVDRVLNMAQMRDAVHLQRHRMPTKLLPEEVDSELLKSAEAMYKARRQKKRLAAVAAATLLNTDTPNTVVVQSASRVAALRGGA